jgi:hypothetical protein
MNERREERERERERENQSLERLIIQAEEQIVSRLGVARLSS